MSNATSLGIEGIGNRAQGTVEWLDNVSSELRTEQRVHDCTGLQDILNDLQTQIEIAQERLNARVAILEYSEETKTIR